MRTSPTTKQDRTKAELEVYHVKCLSHGGTVCIELPDRSVPSPRSISSYRLSVLIASISKLILTTYLNHRADSELRKDREAQCRVGARRHGPASNRSWAPRRLELPSPHEGLLEIPYKIFRVFETDGQPHEPVTDASGHPFAGRDGSMGHRRGIGEDAFDTTEAGGE